MDAAAGIEMILTVTLNPAIDKFYVINRFDLHSVMRVESMVCTAGGKGMNVARVAALSGSQTLAMGFIGGYTGELYLSLLDEKSKNITPAFTKVKGETRTCINVHDGQSHKSTEFLEPGEPVTSADIERFLDAFNANLEKAAIVTISGSVPKGIPDDFYSTLVERSRAAGRKVIVDTSGAQLLRVVNSKPTMIKPNIDEIGQLTGYSVPDHDAVIDAVKKFHQDGIEWVVVSLGADGLIAACDDGIFAARPPKLDVVNTVGSGDSLVAGFAVSMEKKRGTEEMLRFAVTVSAANTLTKTTGWYEKKDFERIYPQVIVEKIG